MRTYCRTLGSIQALAQILGIRDLHAANIVPHQQRPHPIDLEAFGNTSVIAKGATTELYLALILRVPPHIVDLDMRAINREQREQLKAAVQEGFNEAIRLHRAHLPQLRQWVQDLPEDLLLRYIPLTTLELNKWLEVMPHENTAEHQRAIAERGIEAQFEPVQPSFDNLATRIQEDLWHGDVPIMHLNLAGRVLHNGEGILRLSGDQTLRQFIISNLTEERLSGLVIEEAVLTHVSDFVSQAVRR